MAEVPYNRDSYNMCLCGGCPVNRSSDCVAAQEKAVAASFELIEKDSTMPDMESMPGIYCSTGKSVCDDLGVAKSCLCPACPVSIDAELNNSYYCLKGSAQEVG